MINWKMIYKIMGFLLFIEAGFLSLCIVLSAFYKEPDLQAFITSTLITIGLGIPLSYAGKRAERRLSRKDGYIVVTLLGFFSLCSACYLITSAVTYPI